MTCFESRSFFKHLAALIVNETEMIMVRDLDTSQIAYSAGCAEYKHLPTAQHLASTITCPERARLAEDAKSRAIKLNVQVEHFIDVVVQGHERRVVARYVPMRCDGCPMACGALTTFARFIPVTTGNRTPPLGNREQVTVV
jgi:hypothetical protein